IARAMALGCDILLLDEPSAGLDPITAANLDRTILRLRENLGFTFVVVTHELSSIFTIADRAVMLDPVSRLIIAEGKPSELRDQSKDPRVRPVLRQTKTNPTNADKIAPNNVNHGFPPKQRPETEPASTGRGGRCRTESSHQS
ncbi:MAG: hypothetical protein WBN68_01380, partial [Sedimenticolaceae bacterium]